MVIHKEVQCVVTQTAGVYDYFS